MIYRRSIRIEFNHCDPAGIVFYPRYFEMTNSVAENFFRDVVGLPYETIIARGEGVPTARITVDFHAPSRLGEVLEWRLEVLRLGNSALDLQITVHGANSDRLTANLTIVHIAGDGRAHPWTADVRTKITAFMEATQ